MGIENIEITLTMLLSTICDSGAHYPNQQLKIDLTIILYHTVSSIYDILSKKIKNITQNIIY